MEPVVSERIGERGHHVLLPDELLELLRPPLAGECLVTHRDRGVCSSGGKGFAVISASGEAQTHGCLERFAVRSVSGEARVGESAECTCTYMSARAGEQQSMRPI